MNVSTDGNFNLKSTNGEKCGKVKQMWVADKKHDSKK